MSDEPVYLIWSNEHRAWRGPASRGYYGEILRAGRYSRAGALLICRTSVPSGARIGMLAEIPVRLEDVQEFLRGAIIPEGIL